MVTRRDAGCRLLVWHRGGGGLRGWWRRGGRGRVFGVSWWRFGVGLGLGCLSLLVIGCELLVLLALLAEDVLESRLVTRNFNNGRLLWGKAQGEEGFYIRPSRLLLPPLTTSPRPCHRHRTTSEVVSSFPLPPPFFFLHLPPTRSFPRPSTSCPTLDHLIAPSWPLQYWPAN